MSNSTTASIAAFIKTYLCCCFDCGAEDFADGEEERHLIEEKEENEAPLEQRITDCADSKEVRQAALRVLRAAMTAEPALTKAIDGTTKTCGGTMIGLEYRLKSDESLRRKIATDVVKTGLTPDDAAGGICDAVRYTSCFAPDDYAAGVNDVLIELQKTGNKIRKLKNSWTKTIPYKGINVQLVDPDGQVFELQFHTPESFKAKDEDTHHIYEQMRVLDPQSEEWAELNRQQMEIFAQVPRPKDVEKIKEV